jgi:hypothetical protein
MDSTPKYVVDTCSFTALRRIYPQDVFPGAWQAVTQMAENGLIISSKEVLIELEGQEDIITEWARNNRQIFIPLLSEIQQKAMEILGNFPNLLDLNNLKSNADPFVIATAILNNCIVVTEEDPSGNGAKLIKIPNVCNALGIGCIRLLDLLRAEQVRLEIKY